MVKLKIITCGTCIDGTGSPAIKNAVILVEGTKIREVGEEGEVDVPRGRGVEEIDCSTMTVLPGLIDSHIHLALGAGSYYEEMVAHSDAHLLITGFVNARSVLDAGITTVMDLGTRNRVAFDLREASETGIIQTPRMLLSGRAITMTGGHFYFCNAVADGYKEVRKTARRLIEEGADVIKVMASGGGTRITDRRRPSYSVEELRGATDVAHNAGKIAVAHCHATQAILNALEAGFDVIEHCSFLEPEGKYPGHTFRENIAREIAKAGVLVDHVMPVTVDPIVLEYKFENFTGLRRAGVQMLAGTDDLFLDLMGQLPFVLELMVRGGMTPMEALLSATSKPSEAMGLDGLIGTVERGKEADLIAVRGNPLEDIRSLASTALVMKGGKVIPPSSRRVARDKVAENVRKVRDTIKEHSLGRALD
ncbi:MAG: amidohydrolase family protein [Candidatus Bathyarchaeota archaeon]|nr:amidohydrolase family protein [Candidatus Bathyarchaeota archaeon]